MEPGSGKHCVYTHFPKDRDCEWYIVWYIAINSLAIFGEMWFLTAFPVVCVPVVLTKFPREKELREFLQEE